MKLSLKKVGKLWVDRQVEKGLKAKSIEAISFGFRVFSRFITEAKGEEFDFREFRDTDGVAYLKWLRAQTARRGGKSVQRYCDQAISHRVMELKGMMRLLAEKRLILTDPTSNLKIPYAQEKSKTKLSEEDVATLLESVEVDTFYGLRDRCILELMYSSGLRGGEIGKLRVSDIDAQERLMVLRDTKVGKDVVVPITIRASQFLGMLIQGMKPDSPVFGIGVGWVNTVFKSRAKAAGVLRPGLTAHSLRASCATHLLARGADIRYVQTLLAHGSIQTTVGYTTELVDNMRRIHKTYHPRENNLFKEMDDVYLEQFRALRERLEARVDRGQKVMTSLQNTL